MFQHCAPVYTPEPTPALEEQPNTLSPGPRTLPDLILDGEVEVGLLAGQLPYDSEPEQMAVVT